MLLVASPIGLTALALVIAALSIIAQNATSRHANTQAGAGVLPWLSVAIWLAIAAAAIFWMVQTCVEYIRRTSDPTWILQFQNEWKKVRGERARAAKALMNNKNHLADIYVRKREPEQIDDVLDVLEDVGFYVHGDQISPEAAHHHLFHWIRGYWFATRDYVRAWREREPSRWEHFATLYDEVAEIETHKDKKTKEQLSLSDAKVAEFLQEEARES